MSHGVHLCYFTCSLFGYCWEMFLIVFFPKKILEFYFQLFVRTLLMTDGAGVAGNEGVARGARIAGQWLRDVQGRQLSGGPHC